MNSQHGGYMISSYVGQIIIDLSKRTNQTSEIKRAINSSITNTGHGCILLGSSARLDGGDRKIRMLVGAHFARHGTLEIGTFGGGCNRNEMTIDTVIRETIEEIFDFEVSQSMIDRIRVFLNINTDYYYIFQINETKLSYSYIFDVSILGVFIKIIEEIYRPQKISYFIPTNNGMTNLYFFLKDNVKYSDLSSFDGDNSQSGQNTTIKLVDFIKTRAISSKMQNNRRKMGLKSKPGLEEIKYMSFVSLSKLVASAPIGSYNIFNFNKNRRENLRMQNFLVSLLGKDIIRYILSYQ